jgi:hypothetical protein
MLTAGAAEWPVKAETPPGKPEILAQSLHKSRPDFPVCTTFAHASLLAQNLHRYFCRQLPTKSQ